MRLETLIHDLKELEKKGIENIYFFDNEEGSNTYNSCIFNQYSQDKTKIFIAPNEASFVDFDLLMNPPVYSKMSLDELKKLAEENKK